MTEARRGLTFANARPVPVEILIGRGLACCAHPYAAWRRLPPSGRALLVAAYAAGSYVTVLGLLITCNP